MQLQALKLVTVIAEEILKDQISKLGLDCGATGYTSSEVQGSGSRGARTSATAEGNIRVQFICPKDVADKILTQVSHSFVENYACIAWMSDVEVVRGARYIK